MLEIWYVAWPSGLFTKFVLIVTPGLKTAACQGVLGYLKNIKKNFSSSEPLGSGA